MTTLCIGNLCISWLKEKNSGKMNAECKQIEIAEDRVQQDLNPTKLYPTTTRPPMNPELCKS